MPILDLTGGVGLADGTVNDLIVATQRHLNGVHRSELTKLTSAINDSVAAATFTYDVGGVRAGSVIAMDDELMYVWTETSGSPTAMERGWSGTIPAAHAAGALVEVEPTFPRPSILAALRDEILSWGPAVYQVAKVTLEAVSTSRAVALGASDVIKVLDVWRAPPSGASTPRRIRFNHLANQNTALYPTGHAITLDAGVEGATDLFITYAAPFNLGTFTSATDLSTVGLSDNLLDIAPLGAAWRLVAAKEVQRNDLSAQGQSRRADEVPATSFMRTAAQYKTLRDQRLADEANRLNARYAWRMG